MLASDGGAVIRIAGDGEFPYSTFALSEPRRFVIDLDGVINRSARSTVPGRGQRRRAGPGGAVQAGSEAGRARGLRSARQHAADDRAHGDALVVSFPAADGSAAPAVAAVATTAPSAAPAKPARPRRRPARRRPGPRARPSRWLRPRPPGAPPLRRRLRPEPSDLALAQQAPPPAPKITRARIEAEDAAPLPAALPPPAVGPGAGHAGARRGSGRQLGRLAARRQGADRQAGGRLRPPPRRCRAVSPSATPGSREKPYFGEPIDLKVTNADVTDVLRTFAQISGLNVIVQPGVTGVVTAELENVPWDQALEQVLKINNLDYELDGNVMRIAPTAMLRKEAQERQQLAAAKALSIPLRTVYQRLSYANADQVARLLRTGTAGLLTQRGSVVVDRRTNALIIKELPTNMDAVLSVIDLLDSPEPQVMIEARIVETTKRFSRDLGINWGFNAIADAAHGNTTGLVFPNNVTGGGGVNLPGGGDNGTLNLRARQRPQHLQPRRRPAGGRERGADQHPLGAQGGDAEQPAGLHPERSADPGADDRQQHGHRAVRQRHPAARRDAAGHRRGHGADGHRHLEARAAARLRWSPAPPTPRSPPRTRSTRLLVRDGGTAVIGGIYKVTGRPGRGPGARACPTSRSSATCSRTSRGREENEELLIFITPRVIKI